MARSEDHRRAKRKEALQKKRRYAELVARANLFPDIVVAGGDAPQILVEAIRRAIKRIRSEHARLLPPSLVPLFRLARQVGFPAALGDVSDLQQLAGVMITWVGELLYQRLPKNLVETYIPYHNVRISLGKPQNNRILVSCRSLLSRKSGGGTVYYSWRKPTLTVNGQQKIVAFSDHAIKRICERVVADRTSFSGSGVAFTFLDNCIYYEDCTAQGDQPCFTFYNACHDRAFTAECAQEVLGRLEPGKNYYYRVGYCPAVIDGEFIKAKTLLLAGMRGTPEAKALWGSALPTTEKKQMADRAEKLTLREIDQSKDFRLVRWFHEHAVPQVIVLEGEVFQYD